MSNSNVALYVFIGFLATFGARLLPYLLFRSKKEGQRLEFIQKNMPLVIMVVLVFYTLFGLDFSTFESTLVGLGACALVLLLQIFFKNALLSMFAGVCFYMLLLRFFG